MKNILIVGNGGREHAIALSVYKSPTFQKEGSKIYCTTGSGGLNSFCEPIDIKPTEIQKLKDFAINSKIDFTIVGPEVPLSMGITDEFESAGLKIFGPNKKAAMIETSKIFAKELMIKNNIPTAKYRKFRSSDIHSAEAYIDNLNYPVVIKADGLAAGKGVIICNDVYEAKKTLDEFSNEKIFGEASDNFIIEEYLSGYELSVLALTDGEYYVMLPLAQDHKKVGENDTGPNTGGMGAYAPLSKNLIDEEMLEDIRQSIIEPTLLALRKEKIIYKGCLYCGLMITEERKPYVIEFNCRFGDPETQAVLPLIKSDFLEMLIATQNGEIRDYNLEIKPMNALCVVLASEGYPGKYETGFRITGLDSDEEDVLIFHSGTKISDDGSIVTSGGRVMSVVGLSSISLKDAADKAYRKAEKINFKNKYFRRDIGHKSLKL